VRLKKGQAKRKKKETRTSGFATFGEVGVGAWVLSSPFFSKWGAFWFQSELRMGSRSGDIVERPGWS